MITSEVLEKRGLVHATLYDAYGSDQRARLDEQLAGRLRRVTEQDVTKFLGVLDGAAENAVVAAMCEVAGVGFRPGLRLISGKQFNVESGADDPRSIDLVVVDRNEFLELGTPEAVIAIEAKFGASVNGRWGYCPRHDGPERGYSNQIICYTHGCVNDALRSDRVKFIWLGLPREPNATMASLKGAINDRDIGWMPDARKLQDEAEKFWNVMDWDQIWSSIRGVIPDPDTKNSILRALGAPVT